MTVLNGDHLDLSIVIEWKLILLQLLRNSRDVLITIQATVNHSTAGLKINQREAEINEISCLSWLSLLVNVSIN